MSLLMKVACAAVYALALAGLVGLVHGPAASLGAIVSIVLLGVHAVELLFVYKYLHRHPGPVGVSVALALLWGVLHWAPLVRRKA